MVEFWPSEGGDASLSRGRVRIEFSCKFAIFVEFTLSMKDAANPTEPISSVPPIGKILRALRKSRNVSLAVLARHSSVSEATLSRIENGRSDASADLLYRLANILNVEISTFFAKEPTPLHSGIRSVMRKGNGVLFTSPRLTAHVLCAELAQKRMHPFVNVASAQTLQETGGLKRHDGEEFLLVLDGTLILHTETYAPLCLQTGDSVYFDANQPHAYVSEGASAEYLVVTSAQLPNMDATLKDAE
jgi:DNA-binding XRE family transcriptional regulator